MSPHSLSSAFVTSATTVPYVLNKSPSSEELSGMRLAVKDLFHMAGIPTAAGNPSWLNSHPVPDVTHASVDALISKGARFVGKTVTDELAYSLNGKNIHYPELLNPVTPDRLVGGSSSGSAAAVSSGQADIGLGTDTGGSIRVPASYNGLFGLRPTHGVIGCENMVGLAPGFDTVGWLTSSFDVLEKVALVLLDRSEATSPVTADDNLSLWAPGNLMEEAEHEPLIRTCLNTLSNVTISNKVLETNALNTSETFRVLQGAEIWQLHGDWINQAHPSFAPDIANRIDWCRQLTESQIEQAKRQQTVIQQFVAEEFEAMDAMVIPTTPGRSPLLSTSDADLAGYREQLMALTAIAGLTGRPQIHLPLFTIDGAPCGVSLIGEKYADLQLISLAKEFLHRSRFSSASEQ